MAMQPPADSLQAFEKRAFALYFVNDIHYPYISITLVSLVAVWLMYGHVPTLHIAVWFIAGSVLNLLREGFVVYIKPALLQGRGYTTVLRGFALSSFLTGLTWGAFVLLYFDASRPLSVLMVGSYLAGHIGGALTPLSIYLPAFYLFVLPTMLPQLLLLVASGTQEHVVLAGLSVFFLFSMSGYAHLTHRMHRESIRLRYENQKLVADLKSRTADAENASRTKSLFLAGISHDLKQPIRAIAMYTGFLRHGAAQGEVPDVVTQTVKKIDLAVGAIHGQISRLLELARLESGTVALNTQVVALDAVFTRAENLFAGQAQATGIRLQFASVQLRRHQRVLTDPGMLESILENLISNAVKQTTHGAVYIGTRLRTSYPKGQQLCIEVRDSGVGIAPELIPLLFDAYRSFDDRKSSESHGLGLAIAKAQASYLGCDITVTSQPGLGSTFTLCGLLTEK